MGILKEVLIRPELLTGVIVLIGYIALKEKWYISLTGFIKAVMGYLMLTIGSGGLVSTFRPIVLGLNEKFNLNAVIMDPYFGLNAVNLALKDLGVSGSWTMVSLVCAFIWNIILVAFKKVTKLRTLLLTGHIMVQQATTVTWIVFLFLPQYRNIKGAIIVGILVGTYQTVFSNLTIKPTKNLIGDEQEFAVGHQQMLGIWLADKLAPLIGSEDDSIEKIKFPKVLEIFNDNLVSMALIVGMFFGAIIIILGKDFMMKIDPTFTEANTFFTYIIIKPLFFTVYFYILQMGVRMFSIELNNSFRGISQKILPDAIPAVDCAVVYGFVEPNVLTIGFLSGVLGQILGIIFLILIKSPAIAISGFVPMFFDNATIAIYANKKGGIKAAIVLPFFSGIIQIVLGIICANIVGLSKYGGWHGNFDFSTVWLLFIKVIEKYSLIGIVIIVLSMLLIPQISYYKNKEEKFKTNSIFKE